MTPFAENPATRRAIIVVALGFMALALAYSARAALSLALPIWETEMDWSRNYVSNVAAIGASLGGYFYATNSSYDLVWMSSLALAVIAGVLVFLLKEKPAFANGQFA